MAAAMFIRWSMTLRMICSVVVMIRLPPGLPVAKKGLPSFKTMVGVMGSNREDFLTAQKLLLEGVFPVEEYSQQFGFAHTMQAMEDSILAKTPKAILVIGEP